MAKGRPKKQIDHSTEDKIKEAARKVFHEKGFAATRTRDIAEEAGLNLALLNYYFKSKENLFEIITFETLFNFIQSLAIVFHDENSEFEEKIEMLAVKYIDFLSKEPNIPVFILTAIRDNPDNFADKIPFKTIVMGSYFYKQFLEKRERKEISETNPLQFLLNLMGLIIFPFIAKPIFENITGTKEKLFQEMMNERKKLIPIWIKNMIQA
ncbi:TetR family transcriptional regulator [Sphingobacterium sp. DK4209]|uniref:TetR family transcriptional regulator n=1 Tax=Sphingobacterium zhuxiongii TaxID=2662364 RepID=A0A5Q0QBA4_9SPHI|nr:MULTISPECIES: TetR family transcriptional regulator [unclassified Sphingobacterium]MVZ65204.1 TetR family transcriptional regulator [Sphingobacterium sp. DK4209]QGA26151.1 TetR family transcriptional regulator [Sphingobacterium sp. dk4302]